MPPIMLIGEAWGQQEARVSAPFVGPSGIELLRMLNDAGVITFTDADRTYLSRYYRTEDYALADCIWKLHPEVYRTNVFNFHPHANDLDTLCGPRELGIVGYPALTGAKYVSRDYAPELERLQREIDTVRPNLIIALGATGLWATCGTTKMKSLRGTTRVATHVGAGCKVLPVYHPAAVLREWSLRAVTVIDLSKANREKEFADVRRPEREIWIEPTLDDIDRFVTDHIRGCRLLSVDIETSGTRVTCIGFAPRRDLALVVPFDDERAKGRSYWASKEDERVAVEKLVNILSDRTIPKLFQNGLYDIAFLWRSWGCPVKGAREDTMLLHHSLQPELQKGLGFLGSIYTDEGSWKNERRRAGKTLKKDQ